MLLRTSRHTTLGTHKLRLLLAACSAFYCAPSSAETLREALSSAYRYNPTLESGRAEVRAVDENVSIAHGRFRPTIAAAGSLEWENTIIGGGGTGTVVVGPSGNLTEGGVNRKAAYGVGISQPIFTGFQNTNQLRVAEAGVRGAREQLRDTESNILLRAVGAYVSVLSSLEVLKAQEQNLSRMEREVRIAKERVKLTELTNTDLSQAELNRANAVTAVATARANLKAARAFYLNVIGHEPNNLRDPNLPARLPKSLAEAQAVAAQENPVIIAALYNEEAARHTVEQIRGQLLPQVDVAASWSDEYNSNEVPFKRDFLVAGRLTVPLYEGGQVHAAVRQAKQIHLARIQSIETARSLVQQLVSTAWSQLEAARTRVDLGVAQIRASEVALEGVRKEEGIGQRTLLDVLNAEQGVVDSRVAVINARRDLVVASYELLAQVGRLDAEHLALDTLVYDPSIHYEEVRRKWFGLNITHADGREEHLVVRDTADARKPMK